MLLTSGVGRTIFASFGKDLRAYVRACAVFGGGVPKRSEGGFNFPKHGGNFEKLFPDRRAVAVNGKAGKVLFPIENELSFQRARDGRG